MAQREIVVVGDQNRIVCGGEGGDLGVRRLSAQPLRHMLGFEAPLPEPVAQRRRELGVDQETHQAA